MKQDRYIIKSRHSFQNRCALDGKLLLFPAPDSLHEVRAYPWLLDSVAYLMAQSSYKIFLFGFPSGQCIMRTADCRLEAECRLRVKCRPRIKIMHTADYRHFKFISCYYFRLPRAGHKEDYSGQSQWMSLWLDWISLSLASMSFRLLSITLRLACSWLVLTDGNGNTIENQLTKTYILLSLFYA